MCVPAVSKILVWLSGGVDSAVVAYLLREAGHEVSCGFMINYISDAEDCPTLIDMEEARKVAEYLNLPFHTFDFQEEYEKRIIAYIYESYKNWLTPNPDILCNNLVKFDCFLEEAREYGFDAIATGHYARIEQYDGWFHLLKGLDSNKDQTYFLSGLNQFQLAHALFPIGSLQKSEVRRIARDAWLPNAERKDSQGLCFIGKVSMKEFLEKRLPKQSGDILDTHNNIIGKHEGAFSYTIGQRKGIEIGGGPALFVVKKDTVNNTITVWTEQELQLYASELIACRWHWLWKLLVFPFVAQAKIRYRQEDQEVECEALSEHRIRVRFRVPQRAISSGQTIVMYSGDELIASGIIE